MQSKVKKIIQFQSYLLNRTGSWFLTLAVTRGMLRGASGFIVGKIYYARARLRPPYSTSLASNSEGESLPCLLLIALSCDGKQL